MDIGFPFIKNKVPIINSIQELRDMLNRFSTFSFCFYLAFKDIEEWEKSTSRVYMNQILPNFIYLPINIQKDDFSSLKEVYNIASTNPNIIAINQTQPHKSNKIIKEIFSSSKNTPSNIDAIVKNQEGFLMPYDLNGPSFIGWFQDQIDSFQNKLVILIGIGGVGEPIARSIALRSPKEIILVDPIDKSLLKDALSLSTPSSYFNSIQEAFRQVNESPFILINATGKEGENDRSRIQEILKKYSNKNYIYIDLRPHLDIPLVNKAKQLGWKGYTGFGMNARNDYTLLQKIASLIDQPIPQFTDFVNLVAAAS